VLDEYRNYQYSPSASVYRLIKAIQQQLDGLSEENH
jgi:hypothetical protein